MNNTFNVIKNNKFILAVLLFISLITLSFFKFSFALGSYKFFFSGINFLAPLIAVPVLGNLLGLFLVLKYLVFSKIITLGLPTFVASFYFYVSSKKKNLFFDLSKFILSVILPLVCIAIFICHPEAGKAYLYSFYWFIPVICYFLEKFKSYNTIFTKSLTATFLAHAVGSIIWLYTINMDSKQWLGLIPMVAIERIVFASSMSLIFVLVKRVITQKSWKKKFNLIFDHES